MSPTTCTIVSVNGTHVEEKMRIFNLVEDKVRKFKGECVESFASASVPFTLTTVQVPNLALTHKKWITVKQVHCNPVRRS